VAAWSLGVQVKKVGLSGMIVLTALFLTAGTPLVARLVTLKHTFARPCHTYTLVVGAMRGGQRSSGPFLCV
jgi:hypothetical protein